MANRHKKEQHRKQRTQQHEPHQYWVSDKVNRSFSTSCTNLVDYGKANQYNNEESKTYRIANI